MIREAAWLIDESVARGQDRREGTALGLAFFQGVPLQTALAAFVTVLLALIAKAGVEIFLLALIPLGMGYVPLAVAWGGRHEGRRAHDLALKEVFDKEEAWLVGLFIHQGAAVTGTDRGVLWFEDGRMVFSGHRTSFALTPEQVYRAPKGIDPIAGLRGRIEVPLAESSPAGPLSISVTPLEPHALRSELIAKIDGWRRLSPARAGQRPPLGVGPGAVSTTVLFLNALGTTLVWPLVATSFALRPFGPGLSVALFLAAVCVALGNETVALRWHAFRDRRQLERVR